MSACHCDHFHGDTSHQMEGNNTAVIPSIYGKLIDMDLNGERMAHVFHVDDFVCVSKDVRSILVEEQGFIRDLQGVLRIVCVDDG